MATGPETRLVAHMRKDGAALYGERLVVIKYHGSAYSESGVSDLLCCLDGTFIACEVKAAESYGGNVERALLKGPTVKQLAFIGRVQAAGGYGFVAATREQFLEGLAAVDAVNREQCAWCVFGETEYEGKCTAHPENQPRRI